MHLFKKNVQVKVCVCQQRIRKMFYYSEWNEKTTKIVLFREKFIIVDNFHIYSTLFSAISIFLPSIMTIKYLKKYIIMNDNDMKKKLVHVSPQMIWKWNVCLFRIYSWYCTLHPPTAPLHIMYVLFSFVQKNGKRFRRKFSGNGKK